MKKISKRFTYANVMSSIAVFLVLGGATALAAGLAKNSVGSKQLKKNSVTAAKIKKSAVTGAKVKDGSLTGSDINVGTLGTVPSANTAKSAESAGNANTVGSQSVTKVFKTLVPGQENVSVASISGFSLTATCESHNIDVVLAAPAGPGSVLTAQGNGELGSSSYFEYEAEEAGSSNDIAVDGPNAYGQASFSGALSTGAVISGELGYDYETFGGENPDRCVVYGEVTSG